MHVIVFNKQNLNSLNNAQWNSFCKYIEPFVEAYTKFPVHTAIVEVADAGDLVTIKFDIQTRESLQTVTAKFDKFLCKEWKYDNLGKKHKSMPPHHITLAWQVFLTKVLGEEYKLDLKAFYKKNKVSTTLISTLIKNSSKEFDF